MLARYPDHTVALTSQDPIDLLLGPDGDLVQADNGDLVLSTGIPAVGQSATIAVLLARGELFSNLGVGVPWFEGNGVATADAILGGKFDQRMISPLIASELQAAPGVGVILSNSAEFDGLTRKLSINFSVESDFGDVVDGQIVQQT